MLLSSTSDHEGQNSRTYEFEDDVRLEAGSMGEDRGLFKKSMTIKDDNGQVDIPESSLIQEPLGGKRSTAVGGTGCVL